MIRPTLRALIAGLVAFGACAALVLLVAGLNWAALLPFAGLALLILLDGTQLPRATEVSLVLNAASYLETGMEIDAALTLTGRKPLPKHMALELRTQGEALAVDVGARNETQRPKTLRERRGLPPLERPPNHGLDSQGALGKLDKLDKLNTPDAPDAPKSATSAAWPLALWGASRGAGVVREARLTCRTALGLAQRRLTIAIDQEIRVGVSTRGAKTAALMLQKRGSMFGTRAQLAKGQGSEFDAMREYQQGMDPRLIDWKQTAKRGSLIAKEMRLEQNHQVYLVFDTGYLMSTQIDGISKLDHAINAALAIGWVASQQGDQVGCYSYDARPRAFAPAKRGKSGYAALKHELSAMTAAAVETNPTYGITRLRQRLNRRALVLVFTDFVDATTSELMVEHLSLMAKDHLVAFISLQNPEVPAAIWRTPEDVMDMSTAIMAGEIHRSRQLVLARLKAAGLFCLDVEPAKMTTDLLNTYISIRERQLL